MATPLLTARDISKRFGATLALDHVPFELAAGEVHALVGENGAGKTTLMNVISGVVQPDSGELALDGRPVAVPSPRHAQALGIATVFQELSLVETVSIGENIFAGRAPSRLALVDWPRLNRDAEAILAELGVVGDARRPLAGVPVSMRQMVEIAKAISVRARILLLDEPTAALNSAEAAHLFQVIAKLKARGIGIVYVSHHLSEVLAIADRITVLRDGRKVVTRRPDETSQEGLVRDMVGREIAQWKRARAYGGRQVLLETRGLCRAGEFRDVSLELGAGEIVGLAGLIGSFRGELGRTLCGVLRPDAGEMRLRGRPVRWTGLAQAVRARVAYIPEDRKADGLFLDMSVAANVTAASLEQVSRKGLFSRARSTAVARRVIGQMRIKARGPEAPVGRLSGGNQQKVLIAKWLETGPEILIIDEPTRGVDVASKREIHGLLARLAGRGAAIRSGRSAASFPEPNLGCWVSGREKCLLPLSLRSALHILRRLSAAVAMLAFLLHGSGIAAPSAKHAIRKALASATFNCTRKPILRLRIARWGPQMTIVAASRARSPCFRSPAIWRRFRFAGAMDPRRCRASPVSSRKAGGVLRNQLEDRAGMCARSLQSAAVSMNQSWRSATLRPIREHTMRSIPSALAASAAILALAGGASSQDTPMQGHGMAGMELPAACRTGEAPAMPGMMENMQPEMEGMGEHQMAFMQGMMQTHGPMMKGMMAEDPDIAFACGMIPHHQGAIGMAEVELQHGDSEQMKEMAQKIIEAQEREIAELTRWIEEQAQ